MMLQTITITCLLYIGTLSADADYYWRRFHGDVPSDAVQAGQDFGYNIYVGRGSHEQTGLYPGPIFPGQNSLTISNRNGSPSNLTKHLEILCSGSIDDFAWIATNNDTVFNNDGLIEVGFLYENYDDVLYIGRIKRKDGYIVGWIRSTDGRIRYAKDGVSYYALAYEALIYAPKRTICVKIS